MAKYETKPTLGGVKIIGDGLRVHLGAKNHYTENIKSANIITNVLNAQAETISKLEAELTKVNTPIDDTNGTRFYYRDGQVWDGIKSLFHIESDYEASWAVSALNTQHRLTMEYMETVHRLVNERDELIALVQDSQAYETMLLDGNDETSAPVYTYSEYIEGFTNKCMDCSGLGYNVLFDTEIRKPECKTCKGTGYASVGLHLADDDDTVDMEADSEAWDNPSHDLRFYPVYAPCLSSKWVVYDRYKEQDVLPRHDTRLSAQAHADKLNKQAEADSEANKPRYYAIQYQASGRIATWDALHRKECADISQVFTVQEALWFADEMNRTTNEVNGLKPSQVFIPPSAKVLAADSEGAS